MPSIGMSEVHVVVRKTAIHATKIYIRGVDLRRIGDMTPTSKPLAIELGDNNIIQIP